MTSEEVHKLWSEGAFRREVALRKPASLNWDSITLSCGHTSLTMHREGWMDCQECMDDALRNLYSRWSNLPNNAVYQRSEDA